MREETRARAAVRQCRRTHRTSAPPYRKKRAAPAKDGFCASACVRVRAACRTSRREERPRGKRSRKLGEHGARRIRYRDRAIRPCVRGRARAATARKRLVHTLVETRSPPRSRRSAWPNWRGALRGPRSAEGGFEHDRCGRDGRPGMRSRSHDRTQTRQGRAHTPWYATVESQKRSHSTTTPRSRAGRSPRVPAGHGPAS